MKKILSLLTVIFITSLLCVGCKSEEKRLATTYTDMFEAGKAYISISTEFDNEGTKIKETQNIAMDKENLAFQALMEMPGLTPIAVESRVILKEKQVYIISNFDQQIIKIDLSEQYDEFLAKFSDESNMFAMGTDDLEFIQSGNEDFKGEKLFFEEYKTPLGNYKYYFKAKELVGMSISTDLLPEPVIATINEVSETYLEELFTLPEGYKIVTAEEAGFEFDLDELFPNQK